MAKDQLLRDYLGFVENWRCHCKIEKCTTIQNILKRLEKLEGVPEPKDDDLKIKFNFLSKHGFEYNYERDIVVNKKSQIALSYEYVDEHPLKKLEDVISKKYKKKPKYFFADMTVLRQSDVAKILDRELFNKKRK